MDSTIPHLAHENRQPLYGSACSELARLNITPEVQSQIQALSLYQLEALADALLDFTEPNNLLTWLQSCNG